MRSKKRARLSSTPKRAFRNKASRSPAVTFLGNETIDLVDDDDEVEVSKNDDVILIDDSLNESIEEGEIKDDVKEVKVINPKKESETDDIEIIGVRILAPNSNTCTPPSSSKQHNTGWIRSTVRNSRRSSLSLQNVRLAVNRAKKLVSNINLNRTSAHSRNIKKQKHKQQPLVQIVSRTINGRQLFSPNRSKRRRQNQRSTVPIFLTDKDLGPTQWRQRQQSTLAKAGPSLPEFIPFPQENSRPINTQSLPLPKANANVAGSSTRLRIPGSLRPIVIDGSNVAVGHGDNKFFSCRGIQIVVDFFKNRGHNEVYVVAPQFRLKHKESVDTHILDELRDQGIMKFTPSREVGGQRITSYDDNFIVQFADLEGGIIVSNDNYRDLYQEKVEWQETIMYRILPFTWMSKDIVIFPSDPLGKRGPKLEQFLRF